MPEGEGLKYLYLVMEYSPKDLRKLIRKKNIQYSEDHVKVILYNSLVSLNFLHSGNIIHRDIKPANILIDEHSRIKIADFGLARIVPKEKCADLIEIKKLRDREEVNKAKITELLNETAKQRSK